MRRRSEAATALSIRDWSAHPKRCRAPLATALQGLSITPDPQDHGNSVVELQVSDDVVSILVCHAAADDSKADIPSSIQGSQVGALSYFNRTAVVVYL